MNSFNNNHQNQNNDINFENTYKMLLYFQDEYLYRHKHYWRTLKMFFILNIVISLLPFISGILNFTIEIAEFPIYVFPFIGLIIAVISYIFMNLEAKRFNAVSQKKYQISSLLPEEYRYINLNKSTSKNKKHDKNRKGINISDKIILANLVFQIAVAAISFIICIF